MTDPIDHDACADSGEPVGGEWGYRIVRGLDSGLIDSGFHYATFSYPMPDDGTAMRRILDKLDQAKDTLAGCLCFLTAPIASLPDELDRRNLPWVTANRRWNDAGFD